MTFHEKSPSKPRETTPGIRMNGLFGSSGNDGTVLFCWLMSKYEMLAVTLWLRKSVLMPTSCCLPSLRREAATFGYAVVGADAVRREVLVEAREEADAGQDLDDEPYWIRFLYRVYGTKLDCTPVR